MDYKRLIIKMVKEINDKKKLYRIYHYILVKYRKEREKDN